MYLSLALDAPYIHNPAAATAAWRESLGGADLVTLPARLGLRGVELRSVDRDCAYLEGLIAGYQAQKLRLVFHRRLYLPGYRRENLSEYKAFLDVCAARGVSDPLVVVHGTSGESLSPVEHRQATVQSLEMLTQAYPRLRFAVEVNRRRRKHAQACDDYRSTLRVVDRCRSERIGICWDLGHSLFNSRAWGEPFLPPRSFLERVVNVHLHDLRDEETHHFLQPQGLPVEEALDALRSAGYAGAVALELSPDRIRAGAEFLPRLSAMVDGLRPYFPARPPSEILLLA